MISQGAGLTALKPRKSWATGRLVALNWWPGRKRKSLGPCRQPFWFKSLSVTRSRDRRHGSHTAPIRFHLFPMAPRAPMSAVDATVTLSGRLLPEGFLSFSSARCKLARLCPALCPVLPPHVSRAQPCLAANRTPAARRLSSCRPPAPPSLLPQIRGRTTFSSFPPPQSWRMASRPQSWFNTLRPVSSLDQVGPA